MKIANQTWPGTDGLILVVAVSQTELAALDPQQFADLHNEALPVEELLLLLAQIAHTVERWDQPEEEAPWDAALG